jgi:hypothetical protein
MTKKVAFYCDGEVREDDKPSADTQGTILRCLGADEAIFVSPKALACFSSGIDWEELSKEGVVAVVLYHTNEACVFGMSLEAEALEFGAYELRGETFSRLRNLAITGQQLILELPYF